MTYGRSGFAPPTAPEGAASVGAPSARGVPPPVRQLDPADLESAVAVAAAARVGAGAGAAAQAAGLIAETVAAVRSIDAAGSSSRPVTWSAFGTVIPVLSGSPGAGASALAAALTDALQLAGLCVLLVDAADPARSGLAAATSAEGPWTSAVTPLLHIRYSWRRDALVARLESRLPAISPGMVPAPPVWRPAVDPLHATVVDIGHDGWRATANPLLGAGGWLRAGFPAPRPVLVVRPTRPSLRCAEQVLARLDRWVESGTVVPPDRMVVTGATRWPRGVVGAAGRRLEPLLGSAVFVPRDGVLEVGGVTDEPVGRRVRRALAPLLTEWELLPPAGRAARRPARAGRVAE